MLRYHNHAQKAIPKQNGKEKKNNMHFTPAKKKLVLLPLFEFKQIFMKLKQNSI